MAASLASCAGPRTEFAWEKLEPLPDALGLAGCFAGASGGALLVAGGANFPGKMPWEGGTKVWRNRGFVLEHPAGSWKQAFNLPFPLGYGVSVTTKEGVLCIGGSTPEKHVTNAFMLRWTGETVNVRDMPPLPCPLANGCGALVGDAVYVAGGTDSPEATRASPLFLRLDLNHVDQGWQALTSWPGRPRMLAMAATVGGILYIVGGADLHPDAAGKPARTYLRDGYAFTPAGGWRRIADMPYPVVAAPSPAPVLGATGFVIAGGDDGSRAGFEPKDLHPGFPRRVMTYSVDQNRWSLGAEAPVSRATAPTVEWRNLHVLVGGEVRPGVRSPEVWAFRARD